MRVLHICHENPGNIIGGRGIHIRHLLPNLNKIGVETFLIAEGEETKRFDDRMEIYPSHRVFLIDAPVNYLQKNMAYYHEAIRHLKNEKFDLVHAHDSDLALCATSLADFFNIPLVSTIHLFASKVQNNRSIAHALFLHYLYEQDLVAASNRVIAISNYYRDEIQSAYRIPAEIDIVPNGVNQITFEKKRNDRFTVFFAGRICEQKGVRGIIDAIKRAPEFRWIISGKVNTNLKREEKNNPYLNELQKLEADYPESVTLTGHLENAEILKLGASADAWIVPSLHAPFEIVGLEAMSVKTPLVCTKIGGFLDYANEENAVFIDFTVNSIIEKLKWIEQNPAAVAPMVERAYETAKKFSWENTACLTKQVYERALA